MNSYWGIYCDTLLIVSFTSWEKAEDYLYNVYESKDHVGYEIKEVTDPVSIKRIEGNDSYYKVVR